MSAVQDKYKELIDVANASGISNLQVSEQGNVLHIDGLPVTPKINSGIFTIN